MLNRKMKPIAVAVGAAFATSLAPAVAADSGNAAEAADPFETLVLEGVLFAADHLEGGCGEDREKPADAEGEGKCGEGKGEGNCGEGNCGEGAEEGEGADGDAEGESEESDDEAAEE